MAGVVQTGAAIVIRRVHVGANRRQRPEGAAVLGAKHRRRRAAWAEEPRDESPASVGGADLHQERIRPRTKLDADDVLVHSDAT